MARSSDSVGPPLAWNAFPLYAVLGPAAFTKVPVREGNVHVIWNGQGVTEPVEEFAERVRRYASVRE